MLTSLKLCGGISVAIPTAIPDVPFINSVGIFVGNTPGSFIDSSKLFTKSTVSFSISFNISAVMGASFASVYRIAAGESPSSEPKLPCPSTNGCLIENG